MIPDHSQLVSVIIPAYNPGEYITETLRSVLHQTHKEIEVIIVDDGSTDEWDKNALWINDERVRLFKLKQNRGIVDALNIGLYQARGEFICRIDADDIMSQHRISRQLVLLDDFPEVDVVGSNYSTIDENGNILANAKLPRSAWSIDIHLCIFGYVAVGHPFTLIRRRAIENVNGYAERFNRLGMEDFDLWLRMRSAGSHFINSTERLTKYRIHKKQLTAVASVATLEAKRIAWGDFLEKNIGSGAILHQSNSTWKAPDFFLLSIQRCRLFLELRGNNKMAYLGLLIVFWGFLTISFIRFVKNAIN